MKLLYKKIDYYKPVFKEVLFDTICVGGGTPTVLSAQNLDKFLTKLSIINLKKKHQFHFEGTPSTFSKEKAYILKKHGVQRITLGAQSTDPTVLKINRRIQSIQGVKNSIKYAKEAGIETVNVDIIGGLPGQTMQSFLQSIKEVINMDPDMIHIYPFSPDRDTLFTKEKNRLTQEDMQRRHEMIQEGNKLVMQHGYKNIEYDSFGKREENKNLQEAQYFQYNSSVLGIGSLSKSHIFGKYYYMQNNYFSNKKDWGYTGIKVNTKDEMIKYVIWNLKKGVDKQLFRSLFRKDATREFSDKLSILCSHNMIFEKNGTIRMRKMSRQSSLVLTKLFYSDSVMKKLKKTFKKEYDPSHDYSHELDYIIDAAQ